MLDQTGTDGAFRWSGVAEGPYVVIASAEGWELDYQNPGPLLAKYADRAVALAVQPDTGPPVELDVPE